MSRREIRSEPQHLLKQLQGLAERLQALQDETERVQHRDIGWRKLAGSAQTGGGVLQPALVLQL